MALASSACVSPLSSLAFTRLRRFIIAPYAIKFTCMACKCQGLIQGT
jgi:hypothetical protein